MARGRKRDASGQTAGEQSKPAPAQDERGRFLSGNTGGGRPRGARNKLGEAFVEALQADFEQHGVKAIATVRAERPQDYLKVIASILPKEVKLSTAADDFSDEELDQRIRQLAAALDLTIEPVGSEDEDAEGDKGPDARVH